MWIDKSSHILRQIIRQMEMPHATVEFATHYVPVLNGEVTDKMLAFDVPELTQPPAPLPTKTEVK